MVDTDYHRIQDLNDFPTIELVEESTGRVFVYRALSLLGPEPGRKIARVRYGDACPKGSEDAFGRCHGIEPERNLGGEDCVVGSFHGNPVNAALGNKYQHEVDYSATGVIPLRWERHYNSHTGRWTSISRINHEPGSVVAKVEHSNGRVIPFTQVNSEWISYPDVQKKLLQLFDEGGAVSGWRYVHEDGFVEIFSPLGKLVEQRHRSGYHISYDHSDPFLVITDPAGRGLIVAYNAEGRVLAVTTPNGQTLTYAYDSLGRLVRVNYGDSSEKFYRYGDTRHPLALTAVIDELGVETATWTYDDQGRAVSYNGPNGVDRVAMDYSQINDRFDPSVTVTNALGKQTTYRFVDQHGARKVASVTGHASENCAASHRNYEYDASGWLVGNEDWDGIRTEYLRDDRGRVMEMIEAVGTTLERSTRTVWHSEWNLPLRREKGGRRTEFIYDSVGNLLHMEQFDISQ